MNVLVYGGSGCGKSAWAEDLCLRLGRRTLYLATMPPHGAEAVRRITRHQRMRKGKGMDTLECYRDPRTLDIPAGFDCLLLECVGNLVAGALFDRATPAAQAPELLFDGILHLASQGTHMILVTNDVFCDGIPYTGPTAEFTGCLSSLNLKISEWSDAVVEIVCGLPIRHKGEWL